MKSEDYDKMREQAEELRRDIELIQERVDRFFNDVNDYCASMDPDCMAITTVALNGIVPGKNIKYQGHPYAIVGYLPGKLMLLNEKGEKVSASYRGIMKSLEDGKIEVENVR